MFLLSHGTSNQTLYLDNLSSPTSTDSGNTPLIRHRDTTESQTFNSHTIRRRHVVQISMSRLSDPKGLHEANSDSGKSDTIQIQEEVPSDKCDCLIISF
ncbi:hypothetical protein JTE90_007115 [Oedothorax gibbosus]|uniref:Uncharacterized protein n=1 Tax=Oedothorax gibbosus TaxID=931172 RepID=A0AAV6VST3_9ARAC|nr:hypothetical protein JTE90_007115 [Oedothorax gibbosus]